MRQTAMAVVHRIRKRKRDAGSYADERGPFDAELARDLVGCAKADATDVAREAVRVFRDQSSRIDAIGLVDAHRPRRADAIAVQEQHVSQMTFCSARLAMIRSARLGLIPVTSRRRAGSCSMTSNTVSPKARTSFLA